MFVEQLNAVMPIVKPSQAAIHSKYVLLYDNKFVIQGTQSLSSQSIIQPTNTESHNILKKDHASQTDSVQQKDSARQTERNQQTKSMSIFWQAVEIHDDWKAGSFVLAEHASTNYYLINLTEAQFQQISEITDCEHLSLRQVGANLDSVAYCLSAMALQVGHWLDKHKYCGCCGNKLLQDELERALVCKGCGNREYIKVHPCVIVKITKGDQILLCRSPHFRPGLYSNVAGFIEPGESAEKAVWREVQEEVGINVKNIRYLGSQTWPFPSQIMLAFEADYDSGDIVVDGVEVVDAKWFSAQEVQEQFVDLITSFSISGWLVKKYLDDLNQNKK